MLVLLTTDNHSFISTLYFLYYQLFVVCSIIVALRSCSVNPVLSLKLRSIDSLVVVVMFRVFGREGQVVVKCRNACPGHVT